jgi:hypothetical protein
MGIGVDVHVHRITNRLGWHRKGTKNPEETRYVPPVHALPWYQHIFITLSIFALQSKPRIMAPKRTSRRDKPHARRIRTGTYTIPHPRPILLLIANPRPDHMRADRSPLRPLHSQRKWAVSEREEGGWGEEESCGVFAEEGGWAGGAG